MKIAFLGKGGSGKSTMAVALVQELRLQGKHVLAIDADHNMDFSYGLGVEPSLFLGSDPERIKEYVGSKRSAKYLEALETGRQSNIEFKFSPVDEYTENVSVKVDGRLRLITAGPHTERVRQQESCSHSLAAPLKVYLPLLKLNAGEFVVIDERAGTDPVATGILSGIDLAVIIREPTINSSRVALQIQNELKLTGVPHIIVDNKHDGIEKDTTRAIKEILLRKPLNVIGV